jgi:hypothetical protein
MPNTKPIAKFDLLSDWRYSIMGTCSPQSGCSTNNFEGGKIIDLAEFSDNQKEKNLNIHKVALE